MKTDICEQCGRLGGIHRHHKDFNHGNDTQGNHERLCPSCHRLKHNIAKREALPPQIDQSKPGWSKGMSWQELLDARQYPNINVSSP